MKTENGSKFIFFKNKSLKKFQWMPTFFLFTYSTNDLITVIFKDNQLITDKYIPI